MKRDMNLIRDILLYIEKQPAGSLIQQIEIDVPEGSDASTVGEHLQIMIEKGLIHGEVLDVNQPIFMIQRMTWEGHDFLNAVKNESVWAKVLTKAKEVGGGLTIDIVKALGQKYLNEIFGV